MADYAFHLMDVALAVDIGGTKMAVGVVDDRGVLCERASVATPAGADQETIFAALAGLVGRFGPFDRYVCCGIGSAGPMTIGGELISPLNIPGLRSFPLAARMAELTGLPCRVENDAKALALAEGWVGAAVGETSYMAMVVSTGIGGGIVLNGRLLDGSAGNAGHIGQVIVASPGRPLGYHCSGSLESEASGTAIAAHSGHPPIEATTAVVAEAGTLVGRAAGSVANLLDLRLVLVAGSVALGFGEPFFAAAQTEMDRICCLDFSREARIEPAGCGHEGPLIGAAAVGLRATGRPVGPTADGSSC